MLKIYQQRISGLFSNAPAGIAPRIRERAPSLAASWGHAYGSIVQRLRERGHMLTGASLLSS
ncbi:MAG: hypothetical protein IJ456_10425 [Bacteroides sp.]|nr:hypothetical protein [Bacteroides sp.]